MGLENLAHDTFLVRSLGPQSNLTPFSLQPRPFQLHRWSLCADVPRPVAHFPNSAYRFISHLIRAIEAPIANTFGNQKIAGGRLPSFDSRRPKSRIR